MASSLNKKISQQSLAARVKVLAVALLLVVGGIPMVSRAFTEPQSTSYPSHYGVNEVPVFLNASTTGQVKKGSLLIGERSGRVANCPNTALPPSDPKYYASCSRLCLNADPTKGTADAANCITNWSDLSGSISGSYLQLLPDNSATVDRGYSRIQGDINLGQLVSLIAEPNTNSGITSTRANGFSDSNYAAWFAGTVFIGNGANNTKLCLNDLSTDGNPPGTCISRWSDVVGPQNNAIIHLQDMSARSNHSPDQGTAATAGPFVVPSLVLGVTTATMPVNLTCGDGMCSIANETTANCPADCH